MSRAFYIIASPNENPEAGQAKHILRHLCKAIKDRMKNQEQRETAFLNAFIVLLTE